jgi:hypothetical protein
MAFTLVALNRKENRMFDQPSRRSFLQTALAAAAFLVLPRFLFASQTPTSFWFLHSATGEAWAVDDPVPWSLENARQPVLEQASEGLLKLTPADNTRIIRLVTRRCKLNMIESSGGRVMIHFWGQQGQGDLRPFFKKHGLTKKRIRVVLIERKREVSTVQSGDDFLYGERLPPFWPSRAYWRKWQRRDVEERDDLNAAPDTWSGFGWKGTEPNCIPWAALKSAWRRTTPLLCLNCDQPTILVNFGLPQCSMLNREARFIHVCQKCRRSFHDYSIDRFDVQTWMVANLDAEVLPDFMIVWGKPVKWQPPKK